jgi:D-alanine-D-alanine ligase
VKSLTEDSSEGIAKASLVDSDEKLAERVAFVHDRMATPALVEQYIEGREIYVGVIGNARLRVLPVWEIDFGSAAPIATEKVKHDRDYQERHKIEHGPAKDLSDELRTRVAN